MSILMGRFHKEYEEDIMLQIPAIQVVAVTQLFPNDRVNVEYGVAIPINPKEETHPMGIGIIDPFLTDPVDPGEKVLCYLYPQELKEIQLEESLTTKQMKARDNILANINITNIDIGSAIKLANYLKNVKEEDLYTVKKREMYYRKREDGDIEMIFDGSGLNFREFFDGFWENLEILAGFRIPEYAKAKYFIDEIKLEPEQTIPPGGLVIG